MKDFDEIVDKKHKKFRLMPFFVMPGSWGLKGDLYEIGYANYYYDDYYKDILVNYINNKNKAYDLKKEKNEIDFRYNMIDEKTYEENIIKIEYEFGNITEKEYEEKLLYCEYVFNKEMTEPMYKKQLSTLNQKPWVYVIDSGFDEENNFFMFFDFNEYFFSHLISLFYNGATNDEIIYTWFSDIIRIFYSEVSTENAE